VDTLARQ